MYMYKRVSPLMEQILGIISAHVKKAFVALEETARGDITRVGKLNVLTILRGCGVKKKRAYESLQVISAAGWRFY